MLLVHARAVAQEPEHWQRHLRPTRRTRRLDGFDPTHEALHDALDSLLLHLDGILAGGNYGSDPLPLIRRWAATAARLQGEHAGAVLGQALEVAFRELGHPLERDEDERHTDTVGGV